jgi:hypothetical protein
LLLLLYFLFCPHLPHTCHTSTLIHLQYSSYSILHSSYLYSPFCYTSTYSTPLTPYYIPLVFFLSSILPFSLFFYLNTCFSVLTIAD